MIEPLEYRELAEKLLEKTREGKLPWSELESSNSDQFYCDLDGQYTFSVWKKADTYGLNMKPQGSPTILFSVHVEDEIYFRNPRDKEMFEIITDLYELARRKALGVPDKLASVAQLLDKI